jgi:hypothetical protein
MGESLPYLSISIRTHDGKANFGFTLSKAAAEHFSLKSQKVDQAIKTRIEANVAATAIHLIEAAIYYRDFPERYAEIIGQYGDEQ